MRGGGGGGGGMQSLPLGISPPTAMLAENSSTVVVNSIGAIN